MNAVVNTTVLSNFASIGQLDALRQRYPVLYLPTQVYDEVRQGLDEGYQFYSGIEQHIYPLAATGWLHLTSVINPEELRTYSEIPKRLHNSEAACIAVAQHRGRLFLSDDRAARTEAQRRNITVSGSLGCLVLTVERKIITLEQANAWLATMIAQGYHSPVTDLTLLLK